MAHRFHADVVDADVVSRWDDDRDCQIDLVGVTLYTVRAPSRNVLTLSRVLLSDDETETFLSEPTIILDAGWASEGGITLVELGPNRLRVLVDAEAAERLEDKEVEVTFDVDAAVFQQMRRELAIVFRDQGVYREQLS
jgi:hypothetical protein